MTRSIEDSWMAYHTLLLAALERRRMGQTLPGLELAVQSAGVAYAWKEAGRRLKVAPPHAAPQPPPVPGDNWQRRPYAFRVTCGTPEGLMYV
jgi:hypothetical protein